MEAGGNLPLWSATCGFVLNLLADGAAGCAEWSPPHLSVRPLCSSNLVYSPAQAEDMVDLIISQL